MIFAGAHLDITNTTIANNTGTTDIGGLQLTQGGTATLNNTIVADNHGNVTGTSPAASTRLAQITSSRIGEAGD